MLETNCSNKPVAVSYFNVIHAVNDLRLAHGNIYQEDLSEYLFKQV